MTKRTGPKWIRYRVVGHWPDGRQGSDLIRSTLLTNVNTLEEAKNYGEKFSRWERDRFHYTILKYEIDDDFDDS